MLIFNNLNLNIILLINMNWNQEYFLFLTPVNWNKIKPSPKWINISLGLKPSPETISRCILETGLFPMKI